jgi:hypothetical protein
VHLGVGGHAAPLVVLTLAFNGGPIGEAAVRLKYVLWAELAERAEAATPTARGVRRLRNESR